MEWNKSETEQKLIRKIFFFLKKKKTFPFLFYKISLQFYTMQKSTSASYVFVGSRKDIVSRFRPFSERFSGQSIIRVQKLSMFEWQVFFSTNTTTFDYCIVSRCSVTLTPPPVKTDRAVRIQ